MDTASFLKPQEPTSANFSFLPFSDQNWRVRALFGLGIDLKGMLCFVSSSIKTTKTFISKNELFLFLTICVFTGAAFLLSCKNFSFVWKTWLTVWSKSLVLVYLRFTCVATQCLIISALTMWRQWLLLSLELRGHWDCIRPLWNSCSALLICPREQAGLQKRDRDWGMSSWCVEQSEHTHLLMKFTILYGFWFEQPQNNCTSKISDPKLP